MSLPSDLSEAALFGSVKDVQKYIREGADVNKRDGRHRIPLDYCVIEPKFVISCKCEGNADKIKDATSVIDGVMKLDTSHLCTYCTRRLEKAKALLESGTNPNSVDRYGWAIAHQCAWNGDLVLLRMCVQKGAKINMKTKDHRLPVQLATTGGHMDVVRYLDAQSCDLKSLCRLSIKDAMGKRHHSRINELPVPPRVKVFLNYSCTYPGFEATLVPPQPWTSEDLHGGKVSTEQVRQFICENASPEFLEENREILGRSDEEGASPSRARLEEMIELFQSMYCWESFKTVKFEEPLARRPRYSMVKLEKKERQSDRHSTSTYSSVLKSFVSDVASALSRI